MTNLTCFQASLGCLLHIVANRHKLNSERQSKLERLLADSALEEQLRRLLTEMRCLELPEDVACCVMQHGTTQAALDIRLDCLFDGLNERPGLT